VAILYLAHHWEERLDSFTDDNGRFCSITLKGCDGDLYSFLNVYVPNLGVEGQALPFIEELDLHLIAITTKFPGTKIILHGDINFTIDNNDYIIRRVLNEEINIRESFENLRSSHDLVDSYRCHNKKLVLGGDTETSK
jgi:exonuclease III